MEDERGRAKLAHQRGERRCGAVVPAVHPRRQRDRAIARDQQAEPGQQRRIGGEHGELRDVHRERRAVVEQLEDSARNNLLDGRNPLRGKTFQRTPGQLGANEIARCGRLPPFADRRFRRDRAVQDSDRERRPELGPGGRIDAGHEVEPAQRRPHRGDVAVRPVVRGRWLPRRDGTRDFLSRAKVTLGHHTRLPVHPRGGLIDVEQPGPG